MKQLTGLDASFLTMETPNTYGHVSALTLFDRPTAAFEPYPQVCEQYASLVGELEPMRRRVVSVPLGLDYPYWVEDPHFDFDYHVREINLAKPGSFEQLADQVCRIVGRPMDRTRPLWEVYVIDGLANGWWAMLTKFHHATLDGAAGQKLLSSVLSTDPKAMPSCEPHELEATQVPSDAELLRMTFGKMARNPFAALKTQARLLRTATKALGFSDLSGARSTIRDSFHSVFGKHEDGRPRIRMPLTSAPPTPWNKSITPHRRLAMRSTSLENIKLLKNATDGTVNDIVMAICTGALRRYLMKHDALPDQPLRAMVPVSIRTGNESDPWTNLVSALIADLPTNCEDPIERVRLCRVAMRKAKQQFDLIPAETLIDVAQTSPPVVSAAATRLASRLKLAERMMLPANLAISNVPGSREPLYFAGAQVKHQFPVSIVMDGQGLNITVQSYLDSLDFGLVVDRDLVPDVADLADMHIEEVEELLKAAGVKPAAPPASGLQMEAANQKRPAKKSTRAPRKRAASKKKPAKKKATRAKKKQ
jgi:diacylglycerol O-acyltransferase / wax synthase